MGGAGGHSFDLLIGTTVAADNVGDGGSTGAVDLDPSTYTVSETFGDGSAVTGFDVEITGDCNPAGQVELEYGEDAECTITNSRRPTLTVTKEIVGGAGGHSFDLLIGTTVAADNVGDGGSTGAVDLDPSTYTVSETFGDGSAVTGFDVEITGDCNPAGQVELEYGEDAECTITNSRRPTLTVTKEIVGGAGGHSFDLLIGTTVAADNVGDGGSTGAVDLDPSTYTVSETFGDGSAVTGFDVEITGDCNPAGQVELEYGEDAECTITNSRRPTLTVTKEIVGGAGGHSFDLLIGTTVAADNVGDGGSTGAVDLDPSTYTVSETFGDGSAVTGFDVEITGDCNPAGQVELEYGEDAECTITNSRRPTLTVTKEIVGGAGGHSFDLLIGTTVAADNVGDGGSTGAVDLDPSTYTVSETFGDGSAVTGFDVEITGDCNPAGQVELEYGEDAECTITNSRRPTLTVTKEIVGGAGGHSFDLLIGTTVAADNVGDGGSTGAVDLDPSTYTVSETFGDGSAVTGFDVEITGDCNPAGQVELEYGEDAECTITNSRRPTLTVTKEIVGGAGGHSFDLLIGTTVAADNVGDGGSTGAVDLDPSTYTVSETFGDGSAVTGFDVEITGDCNPAGQVELEYGEDAECTITNSRRPTLTVTKEIVGGAGGHSFDLLIGTTVAADNVGDGGSTGAVDLDPSTYTVSETFGDGSAVTGFDVEITGDCNPAGQVELEYGEDAECTITNSRRPTLTVTKEIVGGAGGHSFDLLIGTTVAADNVGDGGSTGAVDLDPSTYTVSETFGDGSAVTGFDVEITGDCNPAGQVELEYGEDAECTITNTRKATLSGLKFEDQNADVSERAQSRRSGPHRLDDQGIRGHQRQWNARRRRADA